MSEYVSQGMKSAIALGDCSLIDRSYHRDKIELRIRLLTEDEPVFGLTPQEIHERAVLQATLKRDDARVASEKGQ